MSSSRSSPVRPGDDLTRAFRRLVRAVSLLESEAMTAAGLPRAQAHGLLAVAAMGRPGMTMVARELGLAPSTVTRLLDPLVRRGLLKREASSEDRRIVVMALTTAGRHAVERLESELDLAYARITAGAGPGSRKRFLTAARELTGAIEQVRIEEDPAASRSGVDRGVGSGQAGTRAAARRSRRGR